jgi:hypothetical protein
LLLGFGLARAMGGTLEYSAYSAIGATLIGFFAPSFAE